MGAGASAQAAAQDDEARWRPSCSRAARRHGDGAVRARVALVVDPTEQAGRFLRYQRGSFLIGESMRDMDHEHLRQLLVGCLKCGSMMTITYETLQNVDLGAVFKEGAFPRAVLDKRELFKESVWAALLRPDLGDPPPHEFLPRDDFALCVVAKTLGGADVPEDFRSAALGAKEVRRNSPDMVEFAFDGELDEVRALIDKGYYVDSVDGRKHTPLSDACAQGHVATVEYLLELGADPNSKSDLSRTPMWRAAYNGEAAMVKLLLEAGGDPTIPTTDFERPFDVAKDDATRDVLSARVRRRPGGRRGAARRRPPRAGGPRRRPRGSCRREVLRSELVELAVAGKTADVKARLEALADDADAHNERPRATANTARDDRGATLLHLAAQHGHLELAELLLTHAATLDPPHVLPGDECTAAKVFFVNVNRRDAKGWTPLSVAVFHDQKRLAKLLLDHGGDPNLANQFGHTAFDVAKDQVASDERTVEMAADDAARDAAPPKKKKGAGAKKAAAVGRMSAKKGGKKKKRARSRAPSSASSCPGGREEGADVLRVRRDGVAAASLRAAGVDGAAAAAGASPPLRASREASQAPSPGSAPSAAPVPPRAARAVASSAPTAAAAASPGAKKCSPPSRTDSGAPAPPRAAARHAPAPSSAAERRRTARPTPGRGRAAPGAAARVAVAEGDDAGARPAARRASTASSQSAAALLSGRVDRDDDEARRRVAGGGEVPLDVRGAADDAPGRRRLRAGADGRRDVAASWSAS
ncbi:hypothetical protein JL722_3753 [Aureococcus anophagefferens]|nr:hypothetical protein JL722_3753 [Aureococcus anophagefferens]